MMEDFENSLKLFNGITCIHFNAKSLVQQLPRLDNLNRRPLIFHVVAISET